MKNKSEWWELVFHLKSLSQGLVFTSAFWSFLWHRLLFVKNKRPGELQFESAPESSLVLIHLKPSPDHARSWAHFKAQCRHVGSLSRFFGHHLQKFTMCWYLSTWFVLFQPRGLYPVTWDRPFPCVWGHQHSHFFALWALTVQSG